MDSLASPFTKSKDLLFACPLNWPSRSQSRALPLLCVFIFPAEFPLGSEPVVLCVSIAIAALNIEFVSPLANSVITRDRLILLRNCTRYR